MPNGRQTFGTADEITAMIASLELDPVKPSGAAPGQEGKVDAMAARYAAGLPLFDTNDAAYGDLE
jgi:hypothetical protein